MIINIHILVLQSKDPIGNVIISLDISTSRF